MTLPDVSNEAFAHKRFVTSMPPTGNQVLFVHFSDAMNVPKMRGSILACHMSAASHRATHPEPLTEPRHQARVTVLCRGCMKVSFGHLYRARRSVIL